MDQIAGMSVLTTFLVLIAFGTTYFGGFLHRDYRDFTAFSFVGVFFSFLQVITLLKIGGMLW